MKAVLALMIGLLISERLLADSFSSGSTQFAIDFSTIGDPGNPGDPASPLGLGAVADTFRMSTYAVNLDAVSKANTAGSLGITTYSYAGAGITGGDLPGRPATGLSWNEAARFVNWLNSVSGHPLAYKFTTQPGDMGYNPNENISLWDPMDPGYNASNLYRNSLAVYYLPSEIEWYKSAYYSGASNVYYDYASQQDSPAVPTPVGSGTAAGTLVYNQPFLNGPAEVDDAGAPSHYGLIGQTGNAFEWMESAFTGTNDSPTETRVLRGGSWQFNKDFLPAVGTFSRGGDAPSDGELTYGFRVASVIPEPSAITLVTLAVSILGAHFIPRNRGRPNTSQLIA
ncbi:MAG: hypothetical protein Fur0032_00690 [Terrimicrobiaceae bacterium]